MDEQTPFLLSCYCFVCSLFLISIVDTQRAAYNPALDPHSPLLPHVVHKDLEVSGVIELVRGKELRNGAHMSPPPFGYHYPTPKLGILSSFPSHVSSIHPFCSNLRNPIRGLDIYDYISGNLGLRPSYIYISYISGNLGLRLHFSSKVRKTLLLSLYALPRVSVHGKETSPSNSFSLQVPSLQRLLLRWERVKKREARKIPLVSHRPQKEGSLDWK